MHRNTIGIKPLDTPGLLMLTDEEQTKFKMIQGFEGELKKRSPQLIRGWQKRYFKIIGGGKYLAYYKTKPKGNEDPKGAIDVENITDIKRDLKDKGGGRFTIFYEGRDFRLEAGDSAVRNQWIEVLSSLKYLITKMKTKYLRSSANAENFQRLLSNTSGGR